MDRSKYAEQLNEARGKIREYIKEEAEKLFVIVLNKKDHIYRVRTSDLPSYGWDQKYHRYMPDIVKELARMGVSTRHSVNHQVDDWDMKLEL